MLDNSGHFVVQETRVVPVGDPLKQKTVLLPEGFPSEGIRGVYQAWNFIDGARQSETDRSILKRCKSPTEAFGHLEKWYDPESEVATQKLYDKFHYFTIPSNSNPIEALHALKDTNNQMAEKGMGIRETFLHAHFVRALPDEYDHVKATLQAMKNRDRAEIIRMVGARYSCSTRRGRSGRPGRPSKRSSRAKAAAGMMLDKVVAVVTGGTQGRGRGGSSSKGQSSSSGGGSSSASFVSGSSHGGGSRPPGHC